MTTSHIFPLQHLSHLVRKRSEASHQPFMAISLHSSRTLRPCIVQQLAMQLGSDQGMAIHHGQRGNQLSSSYPSYPSYHYAHTSMPCGLNHLIHVETALSSSSLVSVSVTVTAPPNPSPQPTLETQLHLLLHHHPHGPSRVNPLRKHSLRKVV